MSWLQNIIGLFSREAKKEPPTDRQLKYAKRLGVAIDPGMSKWDVSAAIDKFKGENPDLVGKLAHTRRKTLERKYDKGLADAEEKWNQFAETTQFLLAIYRQRNAMVVDVLQVNETSIDQRGNLVLGVTRPKLVKDKYAGDYLDWDCYFKLNLGSLLYYEPLHAEFWHDGIDAYTARVAAGLKTAKSLSKGK